jgi:demethylspheroidene O-methyltransferase
MMFDLPPVLALARENLRAKGLSERVSLHPGSFLDDPLPRGADLISLVRVAHDHPDAVVRQILQKAYDALPVGGTLLVAEPMAQSVPDGAAQKPRWMLISTFICWPWAMDACVRPQELMDMTASGRVHPCRAGAQRHADPCTDSFGA